VKEEKRTEESRRSKCIKRGYNKKEDFRVVLLIYWVLWISTHTIRDRTKRNE